MLVASAPNLATQGLILAENGISPNGQKTLVRTASACTVYNSKWDLPGLVWLQSVLPESNGRSSLFSRDDELHRMARPTGSQNVSATTEKSAVTRPVSFNANCHNAPRDSHLWCLAPNAFASAKNAAKSETEFFAQPAGSTHASRGCTRYASHALRGEMQKVAANESAAETNSEGPLDLSTRTVPKVAALAKPATLAGVGFPCGDAHSGRPGLVGKNFTKASSQ